MTSNAITCPRCKWSNPHDSRFCANCRAELTLTCKRCTTHNPIDATYCKNCGAHLASSTNGFTLEFAQKWSKSFFEKHGDLCPYLWTEGGVGTQHQRIFGELWRKIFPNHQCNLVFQTPIRQSTNCCVKSVTGFSKPIQNGYFAYSLTGVVVADFDLHLIAGVPYSKIKNANLANDVITLCTSDSKQITASFAVPRPSAGLAFVGDFLHFTVDAATKTDEVVSEMRGNRRTQAFNEKQKAANDFIFDIFNLLTQVIES